MWRRFFWLVPAVAAVACTGLYLENGNAYPCDFSEGPGVRDAVCLAGDVCGTDNVCKKYIYEGPRFEGPATLPEYGPGSGEGAVLHPLVLKNPAVVVSADLPLTRLTASGYVQDTSGALFQWKAGHVGEFNPRLPMLPGRQLKTAQTFFEGLGLTPNVLLSDTNGGLAVGIMNLPGTDPVRVGTFPFDAFVSTGSRVVGDLPDDGFFEAVPIAWNASEVGAVRKKGARWEFEPWFTPPDKVLDVAGLIYPRRGWLLALLANEVKLYDPRDGGVSIAAELGALAVSKGTLRTDPGNRIIAGVRRESGLPELAIDVLSTYQVTIDAIGPALTSPWPDCAPCRRGEHVEVFVPSVRTGVPTVEVVCTGLGLPQPLRVIGSVGLTQSDRCLTEELEVPLNLGRVATTGSLLNMSVVQWNSQTGVLVGGRHGEVWRGETISTLLPEFLDRVPRDVAPARSGAAPSLAVIAGNYLAMQQTTDTKLPLEQLNGFRRVATSELGVGEGSRLLGFVHGVEGWGVASGGEVVQVRTTRGLDELDGGQKLITSVRAGPRLVTASEEPIRDSIGGEAFTQDGNPVGFFVAADDSLYFVPDPEASLLRIDEQELLTPDLTPEPSAPIRSLALERTPLGTDGVDRARGYLVTARNVYAWELSGNPARWSSTPLVLAGGEPLEVWFDSPRSALGRVGYRDGQIFSLPGGYQLAEALPASDGGVPPQVLDYENLGGWPVAYATTGLFIAGWDQVGGKLQNRFDGGVNRPMTWRELKLEGDATPWMRRLLDGGVPRLAETTPGKLFVAVDPRILPDAGLPDAGQLHRLLLFTDDEVRQVARHLRK